MKHWTDPISYRFVLIIKDLEEKGKWGSCLNNELFINRKVKSDKNPGIRRHSQCPYVFWIYTALQILNEKNYSLFFLFFPFTSLSICHSYSFLLAVRVGARMCPSLVEPANFCLEWKGLLFSDCHFIWLPFFEHYTAYAQGNTKTKVIFLNVKCKFHI